MVISFSKYQGAGNDFILIDNRNNVFQSRKAEFIAKLCDRRFGIGGDGLMLLQEKVGWDFEMVYYNADGNLGSMCGNGGRCIAAFARRLGIAKEETNFLAVDGPHYAKISDSGDWVSLKMIDVDTVKTDKDAFILNTGSPHYVRCVHNLSEKDIYTEGKAIRNSEPFVKEGINVNFIEDFGEHYFVRTYERGVEDETFACGTGVTASAMAMAKMKGMRGEINIPVRVLGGNMNIRFQYDGSRFTDVFLEGPAKFVFEGKITV